MTITNPKMRNSVRSQNVISSPAPPMRSGRFKTSDSLRRSYGPRVARDYAAPFCKFLKDNPTVFHTVAAFSEELTAKGFFRLSEREDWQLSPGGKYFLTRNDSSIVAFSIGNNYKPGNGFAMIAGHIDALTARLKPVSTLPVKAGYMQMGVAPYAGALNSTWWDRDLGVGGRVIIQNAGGSAETRLVKLDWPIARIPTLAPHFGKVSQGPFNLEKNMVPIIGIDPKATAYSEDSKLESLTLSEDKPFSSLHTPELVREIIQELRISDPDRILNWDLELFDIQPAQIGGVSKDFIFGGRLDDKLCTWAAMQALIEEVDSPGGMESSVVKLVAGFDNEEIGSLLKQGANSNLLPMSVSRIVDSFGSPASPSLLGITYANSFLVSADVTHAVNPNFLEAYMSQHAPGLNKGVSVSADPNGHMTTDAVSTALFHKCVQAAGQTAVVRSKDEGVPTPIELQMFQIRNDSVSGGTVGPMLSSRMGVRAIDVGIPQLSMHSIRATTGADDPGLGVATFAAFLHYYEQADQNFQEGGL